MFSQEKSEYPEWLSVMGLERIWLMNGFIFVFGGYGVEFEKMDQE